MEMSRFRLLPLAILMFLCHACVDADETNHQQKTYIIHMDKSNMPASFDDHQQWYDSSLKLVSVSADMLYTYNNVIHGYSARLTSEEARLLEEQPGVLSVQEEVQYELHTTRSPEFLGLLNDAALPVPKTMSEVIIGVLDSGVWPESRSFDDKGLGPVPSGWKGECEVGETFNKSSCNRKLIGARYFSKGYEAAGGPINEIHESKSPRDDEGHGTHTATTAAGSTVVGASLFGYAAGTAHGMAKHARVAVYKVCWLPGCLSSDILAGMEKAIEDGVNILSLSLGGKAIDYFLDVIAIGAFTATSRGIFVSCAAGNGGPSHESLSNVAPWITTVGAGTIDRQFPAYISLGNGKNFTGSSLYSGKPLPSSLTPLVFAGNVNSTSDGNLCFPESLIPEKVKGKIVICDRDEYAMVSQGLAVKDAGGIGIIIANTEFYGKELVANAHLIPGATVNYTTGDIIKKYVLTEPNPTATIATGYTQVAGVQPSPVVAFFSSRGPNPITKDVLKPDLIAPGVEILAGWTRKTGPTGLLEDIRQVDFSIISGTSMSCPHTSGLAALIKAAYPDWSPAAIRSALMTTAYNTYKNGQRIQDIATGLPATPYDYGAGHVDPTSALDPGLVYDATIDNYIDFLCAINYSSSMIKTITKQDHSCKNGKKYRVGDLNYPSFSVLFRAASGMGGKSSAPTVVQYTRTLTNVGNPATYRVSLSKETKAVKIMVEPEVLAFSEPKEKKRFTVTFTASSMPSGTTSFDYLKWTDGKHVVGSPIAFSWS